MARVYHATLYACAVSAALLLGAVALLVAGDVIARNIGLGSLPWILEVSEYSLPLATCLIAPWLLHSNAHVRLDILLTVAPERYARRLDICANAIGLAVCVVFVVYGAKAVASSAAQKSLVIKALVFPEWWLYAPVPVCFALLGAEFVRRIVGNETIPRSVD